MSKEMKQKAVNIKRSAYALASTDGENATLTMYGDIYETRPIDWWTGEPMDGDFILLDEFLRDLDEIQRCRSLTIRMNSYGGDANVANVIHNRLREMSRSGMETVCIVDGVAMSGGSLIMCACDRVEVNPSSLIMIHNCWGYLWGGYNAGQLRELAEQYDAWDKMQASIYARKTA
ncbi:MAG: Clp protease ClpP, partial [Oscillospiraceae bacterium]|nr:Clp protease ClpP [Oscillospiraceae bacterium]